MKESDIQILKNKRSFVVTSKTEDKNSLVEAAQIDLALANVEILSGNLHSAQISLISAVSLLSKAIDLPIKIEKADKILLKNGQWIEAGKLKLNDELMKVDFPVAPKIQILREDRDPSTLKKQQNE